MKPIITMAGNFLTRHRGFPAAAIAIAVATLLARGTFYAAETTTSPANGRPDNGALANVISWNDRVELFNGLNFDGWTFCMKNDADPMKTWSVANGPTNGVIHCNGSAVGYLRSKQGFSNYVLVVEWRFTKVEPKKDNTGVLVNMQSPDKIWPPCVQNQGKSGRQGDLFVMAGAECKEHLALGKDMNTPVAFTGESNERPVGEWNTNITLCLDNRVLAAINGKLMNQVSECTVSNGFVGVQSEGADFEIRRMTLFPVPSRDEHLKQAEPREIWDVLEPKFRNTF